MKTRGLLALILLIATILLSLYQFFISVSLRYSTSSQIVSASLVLLILVSTIFLAIGLVFVKKQKDMFSEKIVPEIVSELGRVKAGIDEMEAFVTNYPFPDLQQPLADLKNKLQALSSGNPESKIFDIISVMRDTQELGGKISLAGKIEYESKMGTLMGLEKRQISMDYTAASIVPVIYDLTEKSNSFSEKIIMEVIEQFSNITTHNHQMISGIEKSMRNLMESNKTDNLAFIIKESSRLSSEFHIFYENMETLKAKWDGFTNKTSEMLKEINGIMHSIDQIAETIEVISLNVSIQAANAGENGKSFQILARDLRDFTTETVKFSNEVKDKVKFTQSSTERLSDDYVKSMDGVYKSLTEIKSSFESFGGIVNNSVDHIKNSIESLNAFSDQIETDIRKIIGKLQFHDLTRQEFTHLKTFVEIVFKNELESKELEELFNKYLTSDEKQSIRKRLLEILNGLITTSNERIIFEKYEKEYGIQLQKDVIIDNKASKELQEDGENVIVF